MRRRGRPRHPDVLTPREWEVLALLRQGRTNEEIASMLGISFYTARFHVSEILGKLGLASRDDAARWEGDRDDAMRALTVPPMAAASRPSLLHASATLVVGAVAVIALAAVGLLVWGVVATRGGGRQSAGRASAMPEALVSINEEGGALTVINPSTLRVVGSVEAGYRPWTAVRHTTNQLLVAQAFGPAPETATPTLRVFDLDNLSSPVASLPMPDKVSETVYAPAMTLSEDERYLFYGASAPVAGTTPCTGDATRCFTAAIRVLDLDARAAAGSATLVRGCTYPAMRSMGEHDALVMCETREDITLTRVSSNGTVENVASFPLRVVNGRPIRERDMGQAADGNYFVVYMDGTVASSNDAQPVALAPSGAAVWINDAQVMPDGRHLLMYAGQLGSGDFTGVIVLDPDDPSRIRVIQLAGTFSGAAPISDTRIAVIAGGEVRVVDIGTGTMLPLSANVPASAEYLASG